MNSKIKHGITYSGLILFIILLLFKQCDTGKPVEPEKPRKTEYIKGKPDTIRQTVTRTVYKNKPVPGATVYDTVYVNVLNDDSLRMYPISENDSTGGVSGTAIVKGHLLSYNLTRTCFNTTIARVDTAREHYRDKPTRTLSVGVFSGVVANQFTYGASLMYMDKQKRSYGLFVDPVNKGGFATVSVPIRLRRR